MMNLAGALVDDRLLIAAAQGGCAQSFACLVDRHYGHILRYLVRFTGDPELASDLTQETFLDAFRHLDRYNTDHSFLAWLYRIARNNALHWRRKLRRLCSLEWLLAESGSTSTSELMCVADQTTALHERDLIQQILNELSASLREALLLHCLAGFTSVEVAENSTNFARCGAPTN